MTPEIYRFLHVAGVLLTLSSLTAIWGVHLSGTPSRPVRLSMALAHGIGLVVVLVSGFGRLGQMGMTSDMPAWVYVKLAVWLFLGGSIVLAKRKARWGVPLYVLWLAAAVAAAYLGLLKP